MPLLSKLGQYFATSADQMMDGARTLGNMAIPRPPSWQDTARTLNDLVNPAVALSDYQSSANDAVSAAQSGDYLGALENAGYAGLAAMGLVPGFGLASKGARGVRAGRKVARASEIGYDVDTLPQARFDVDYPNGAPGNVGERLRVDIDGRPIGARSVVGRQVVGGENASFSPAGLDEATEGLTGKRPQGVAPGVTRYTDSGGGDRGVAVPKGAVGVYRSERGAQGRERHIFLSNNLSPSSWIRTGRHEFGHLGDDIAGVPEPMRGALDNGIPQQGIKKQLREIYNEGNNRYLNEDKAYRRKTGKPPADPATMPKMARGHGPEVDGYAPKHVDEELMAEALRVYLENPNWLKTKYPEVAQRIRDYWNVNPELNKWVHLNSMAGGGVVGSQFLGGEPAEAAEDDSLGSILSRAMNGQ